MAPQQISACRGTSICSSPFVSRMGGCAWSGNWRPGLLLESRTIEVALHSAQLLYPKILWLLTRSSVRSPHASHANTHHFHTMESGVNPISIPPGRAQQCRMKTLLPSNNSSPHSQQGRDYTYRTDRDANSSISIIRASASIGTLSNRIYQIADHDTTSQQHPRRQNHVSILQISVPRPECRKRPIGPLSGHPRSLPEPETYKG